MKYVILIHSNPQPWGHPTSDFVAEFQALPQEQRDAMNADFEAMLDRALGERRAARRRGAGRLRRAPGSTAGTPDEPLVTDGPYSEAKEHLAGFFLDRRREPGARRGSSRPGSPDPARRSSCGPSMPVGGDDQ